MSGGLLYSHDKYDGKTFNALTLKADISAVYALIYSKGNWSTTEEPRIYDQLTTATFKKISRYTANRCEIHVYTLRSKR